MFGTEGTRHDFNIARTPTTFYLYIRAIQGHSGGKLIALVSSRWKGFFYHRGCSFDARSILQAGLIAGGRESNEERQTVFFTPLNPFGDEPDEEGVNNDLSRPRKVHHNSKWKPHQLDPRDPGRKKKDCSFGRQDLRPFLFTIQCLPVASKSGIHERRQNPISETLYASACCEGSCQKCLKTEAAAARHTIKHRETCCGGRESI